MANLRLSNVSKEFGGRVILDGITAEFNSGEIVGLVGANGTGKTTLFRILDRQLEPDSGTVTASKGLRIGYLTQDPAINPHNTLFDEVATAFEELRHLEHQQHDFSDRMANTAPGPELDDLMAQYDKVHARFLAAGGYQLESRMNEILGGLGFSTTDYELPMSALSGGQQCRAALARLLLEENTFLLLDEPTNHLDIDAVAWLEKFLAGHSGGALVISHDRYLLDRIVDRIIELDHAQLFSYPGNYSNYVKTRDTRRLTTQRQFKDDQAFITKERAFIAKHMGKQRTAEAKGRLKRLERRLAAGEFVTDRPRERQTVKLKFETTGEVAPEGWVFDVQDLAKAFDDKHLFSNLSFQVQAGQRLGITGPNGTGKSTLLKIVLGLLEADDGQVRTDPRADVGYFVQDSGQMTSENTLTDELLASNPELSEPATRSQLARFRFFGEDVFKTVGTLSGGERARLRLLQLILRQPNVIVLDEPTNHLDIPSREVLEAALDDFPGAIVAVSHDRYFLDRIVSHVLVLRPNQHELHPGNYSSYAEALEQRRLETNAAKRPSGSRKKGTPKQSGSAKTGEKQKRNPHEKKSLEVIEELIIEHETKLAELSQMFGDEEVYTDPERLAELEGEIEIVQANLNELEAAWEMKAAEE